LRRHGDLGADVAELSCHREDEFLVLPDGLVLEAGEAGGLLGLESHVCVGDFGDGGEEEDDGEEEDKGGNGEVGPLDVGLGVENVRIG